MNNEWGLWFVMVEPGCPGTQKAVCCHYLFHKRHGMVSRQKQYSNQTAIVGRLGGLRVHMLSFSSRPREFGAHVLFNLVLL